MDLIRSAPGWLIITVVLLLVVLLIGAGPFAGFLIERNRRAVAFAVAAEHGGGFFADAPSARPLADTHRSIPDVTWAGTATLAERAKGYVEPPMERTQVIMALDAGVPFEAPQPGVAVEVRPDGLMSLMATTYAEEPSKDLVPSWAGERTEAFRVAGIFEAEIVEAETEAERLFKADPLGSWVLPPVDWEEHYLPTADEAFMTLARSGGLTGEGSDVSTEWESWYTNYEQEEVYA